MQARLTTPADGLGWIAIIRLGMVQAALGAIVVLTTSTMNRVMVIELAWAAAIPGALVGLHYAVQVMRPLMGHGSDRAGRRTPWIVGGVGVLMLGAIGASLAILLAGVSVPLALVAATLAFAAIGVGVGAGGTALLVLLAAVAGPRRRAPAATIAWVMMITGFVVTTAVVSAVLDPYSPPRLVAITAAVGVTAWLVTCAAVAGLERRLGTPARPVPSAGARADTPAIVAREAAPDPRGASVDPQHPAADPAGGSLAGFFGAFAQVWAEPQTRRFAVFVFVSMLAYSAQDLILEPFAGVAFSMTPGESTGLSSVQHGGVLLGMLLVALMARGARGEQAHRRLWRWTVAGCAASAIALVGIALSSFSGGAWPIRANVFMLGAANGAYAVAAIATMMNLVDRGHAGRQGLRMGTWGAAQALAFGFGGFVGASASDLARWALGSPVLGYGLVFALEAALFVVSGLLAWRLAGARAAIPPLAAPVHADGARVVPPALEPTS